MLTTDTPLPATSDEILSVADKTTALLKRRHYDAMVRAAVNKLVGKHVGGLEDDELGAPKGFLAWLSRCNPWAGRRGTRVATVEATAGVEISGSSAAGQRLSKNAAASAASRLFGTKKTALSESKKLLDAIAMADAKVLELSERIELGRKRAVALRKEGKRAEAIMALKKAKNDEKLLASASAALETLEGQKDMLENAALQRELASALASTTKQIKGKTKGLVKFAEKAVDDTQDLRDDAEDLSAAFEGIQPTFAGADQDELLEELNAMMAEEEGGEPQKAAVGVAAMAPVAPVASVASAASAAAVTSVNIDAFPSAPQTAVRAVRAARAEMEEAADAAEAAEDEQANVVLSSRKAERKAAKKPLLSAS